MGKIKYFLSLIGVVLILVMAIFMANPRSIKAAEDCRIVKISGIGSPVSVRIEPETLSIPKGTCVVWVNWARATEVKIKFKDGNKCVDATQSPVGFRMDAMNCYVTDHVPLGATSSLMFNKEGTFDYEVGAAFATPVTGRIIVK